MISTASISTTNTVGDITVSIITNSTASTISTATAAIKAAREAAMDSIHRHQVLRVGNMDKGLLRLTDGLSMISTVSINTINTAVVDINIRVAAGTGVATVRIRVRTEVVMVDLHLQHGDDGWY